MNTPPTGQTSRGVIFVRHQYKRMGEAQLRAALAAVPEDDPRMVAFNQLIDEELGAAMLEVSLRDRNAEQRAHAAGAVAALSDLKGRLEELRQ